MAEVWLGDTISYDARGGSARVYGSREAAFIAEGIDPATAIQDADGWWWASEEDRTGVRDANTVYRVEYDDTPPRVPDELSGMSANERGVWLSVERFYDAGLRAEGMDRNGRTPTQFRDLVPDAQFAVIQTLVPVLQMLHSVALNPEARRG